MKKIAFASNFYHFDGLPPFAVLFTMPYFFRLPQAEPENCPVKLRREKFLRKSHNYFAATFFFWQSFRKFRFSVFARYGILVYNVTEE